MQKNKGGGKDSLPDKPVQNVSGSAELGKGKGGKGK